MKKAIIFDFDGVLIDSFEIAYGVAKEVHGNISREDYRNFFMGNVYEDKQVTEPSIKKFFALQRHLFNKLKLDPGVITGLEKLVKDYHLFIISSNEEREIEAVLQNSHIENIFTEFLGCNAGKSKVDKFGGILDRHRLGPDDCVFVTDTLGDILEANSLKIDVIAVDYGFHDRSRLKRGKVKAFASSFSEVVEIVEKIA